MLKQYPYNNFELKKGTVFFTLLKQFIRTKNILIEKAKVR